LFNFRKNCAYTIHKLLERTHTSSLPLAPFRIDAPLHLRHLISPALATVQTSLAFTPYLTHKKQQETDLGWTKVPHWSRVIWKMSSGI